MNSTELHQILEPGESLGQPTPIEPGDAREIYGYEVYPVTSTRDTDNTNAVFLDIEPGGSTEFEHTVRRGQTLTVKARRGAGELVVYEPGGQRRIHDLAPGLGAVCISEGNIYKYLNTGSEDHLTVFDQSRPIWLPDDGISLEEVSSLDGLKAGDYILIWNQREPGRETDATGATRLAILEEHDTNLMNRQHANQAKHRATAPHWHALAQKVGDAGICPVNLWVGVDRIRVTPYGRAFDIGIGQTTFSAQQIHKLFKRSS